MAFWNFLLCLMEIHCIMEFIGFCHKSKGKTLRSWLYYDLFIVGTCI